jgi:hypothetical protein
MTAQEGSDGAGRREQLRKVAEGYFAALREKDFSATSSTITSTIQ